MKTCKSCGARTAGQKFCSDCFEVMTAVKAARANVMADELASHDPLEELNEAVAKLRAPASSSMARWIAYWEARNALRDIGMASYQSVIESYASSGHSLDLPDEGFKEIASDLTLQMRTVTGETAREEMEEHEGDG